MHIADGLVVERPVGRELRVERFGQSASTPRVVNEPPIRGQSASTNRARRGREGPRQRRSWTTSICLRTPSTTLVQSRVPTGASRCTAAEDLLRP